MDFLCYNKSGDYMFKKDKKLDTDSLNELISTSNKLVKIGFTIAIIALIVLILSICKTLHVVKIIKELLIVISPVFIGLIIAWLFDPVVQFLTNKKIPRLVACIIVYLFVFGILTLLFVIITPSLINQIKDFISTIPSLFSDLKHLASNVVNNFSKDNHIDLSGIKTQIIQNIENMSINITTDLPNTFMDLIKTLVSGGMFLILGIMIGFYMLYDFNKMNHLILKVLPNSWKSNAKELAKRINSSLRGYVSGVLLVMLLVFLTQAISLTIIGLKAPLVFALFCALTDIIPYFGPYIGAIPAVIVAFTISPLTGIFCIIAIVIVQLLENNFYQPLIMGHAMKLHPVVIILGLLVFEHFFGIGGMIVATPVIATLKVILTFINEKIDFMSKIKGNEKIEEI